MGIRRILVPTDFSPLALAAIPPARAFAERFGATVDVLHVWEGLPRSVPDWSPTGPGGPIVPAREVLHDLAAKELEHLLTELRATGMTVHGLLQEGSPWREITRLAERDRYDLIVLGTHGRTGLDRVLIGSVAEKVVRHAPCPVFVARAETPQASST